MADPDLNIKDVIDALDSSYCHDVVAGLWADAVAIGPAGYHQTVMAGGAGCAGRASVLHHGL